ncbi:hypothetical protein [Streptacidiphilus sp. EB129]|uniref:hypothetical protein n=1 Tax=Streptacidiphilus sp. EB129 TaxID=3156262 RepID=UPI003519180C
MLRDAVEAEWGDLYRAVRNRLVRDRLAALPLTLTATLAVLVFQVLQHTPGGAALVERVGVVRASLPLWESLLRTPLSLFVPAPALPVWGAAAQVFVVFGVAELAVGRWRTLAVAYAGTLAGTVYARGGMPWDNVFARDTGPSAAVVALAVYVAWRCRAWLTAVVTVTAMVLEQVLEPNLAGVEHLAAIACALTVAAGGELLRATSGRARGASRAVS